jgi:hypothetical protein
MTRRSGTSSSHRVSDSPGNHEYNTAGGVGYCAYFGAAAQQATKGNYSFNIGSWHVLALTLRSNSYDFAFNAAAESTFTVTTTNDAGTSLSSVGSAPIKAN